MVVKWKRVWYYEGAAALDVSRSAIFQCIRGNRSTRSTERHFSVNHKIKYRDRDKNATHAH